MVGDLDLTYNSPGTKDYIHNGGFKKDVSFLQEVVVIKGVAHFLHEEKPDEINEHIHDFFLKFLASSSFKCVCLWVCLCMALFRLAICIESRNTLWIK